MFFEGSERTDRDDLLEWEQYIPYGQLVLGGSGFRMQFEWGLPSTMAFAHDNCTILINPRRIEEQGLTKNEKKYVVSHEAGHFVQFASDPKAYLETFDSAEKRAENMFPEGDLRKAAKERWGAFYNVFLDIHDNAIVDHRSLWLQSLAPSDHPREIRCRKLTREDMRGAPQTDQFLFGLLRRAMLGVDTPLMLDKTVQDILDAPYTYFGRTYSSFFHFVREKFFDHSLPLATLIAAVERTAAPIFEALMRADAEENRLKEPVPNVDMNGRGLDQESAKQWAKGLEKVRAGAKDRGTATEEGKFLNAMRGKGFSEPEVRRMIEIRKEANDMVHDMVDMWDVFRRPTTANDVVERGPFRSGAGVIIDEFVRQFPEMITSPDRLRIFSRRGLEPEREVFLPKLIELHLVLDLSGSMDDEKRRATQVAAYALAKSLVQYRRNREMLADQDEEPMRINLNIFGFGSTYQAIFTRSAAEQRDCAIDDENAADLDERLWRAILAVQYTQLGGTEDERPLADVFNELSRADRRDALVDGERVAVVLEVTDGETQTPDASARLVRSLNALPGVHAHALHLPGSLHADVPPLPKESDDDSSHSPDPSLQPTGAFEHVWGKCGKRLDHVGDLPTVMSHLLFKALREEAEKR